VVEVADHSMMCLQTSCCTYWTIFFELLDQAFTRNRGGNVSIAGE
jgi:hypothetical protein